MNGMLEGQDYNAFDTVFPFVAAFLDRKAGHSDEPKIKTVHTIYSFLIYYLMLTPWDMIGSCLSSLNLRKNFSKPEAVAQRTFGNIGNINLFAL